MRRHPQRMKVNGRNREKVKRQIQKQRGRHTVIQSYIKDGRSKMWPPTEKEARGGEAASPRDGKREVARAAVGGEGR